MEEYWFARRYPKGSWRRKVSPIHARGWMVVGAYLALTMIGGLGAFLFAQANREIAAITWFVAFATIGAGQMFYFAATKTDPDKTLQDYRNEKKRAA